MKEVFQQLLATVQPIGHKIGLHIEEEDGVVAAGRLHRAETDTQAEMVHTVQSDIAGIILGETLAGLNDSASDELRHALTLLLREGESPAQGEVSLASDLAKITGSSSTEGDAVIRKFWSSGDQTLRVMALQSSIGVTTPAAEEMRREAVDEIFNTNDGVLATALLESLTGRIDSTALEIQSSIGRYRNEAIGRKKQELQSLRAGVIFPDETDSPAETPPVFQQIDPEDLTKKLVGLITIMKADDAMMARMAGIHGHKLGVTAADFARRDPQEIARNVVTQARHSRLAQLEKLVEKHADTHHLRDVGLRNATCVLNGIDLGDGLQTRVAYHRFTEIELDLHAIDGAIDALGKSMVGVPVEHDTGVRRAMIYLANETEQRAPELLRSIYKAVLSSMALCDDDAAWEIRDEMIRFNTVLGEYRENPIAVAHRSSISDGLALSLGGLTSPRANELRARLVADSVSDSPEGSTEFEKVSVLSLFASVNTARIAGIRRVMQR